MPTQLTIPTEIDLDEFISKEAHDLKSPFNRILGFLKLVLRGMDGPIPDLAKEDLTTAYVNGMQALLSMSSLVEMARLKRGERKLAVSEFQGEQLVKQVVAEWKKVSPKICPVQIAEIDETLLVRGDEGLLRQCLLNWIMYVLEFTAEEAVIEIEVREGMGRPVFSIRSTGKKSLTQPEMDLTMYGYIAKQIVELHEGEMLQLDEDEMGAKVVFGLGKLYEE